MAEELGIVSCEDVFVAVPVKKLCEESSVLKEMIENHDRRRKNSRMSSISSTSKRFSTSNEEMKDSMQSQGESSVFLANKELKRENCSAKPNSTRQESCDDARGGSPGKVVSRQSSVRDMISAYESAKKKQRIEEKEEEGTAANDNLAKCESEPMDDVGKQQYTSSNKSTNDDNQTKEKGTITIAETSSLDKGPCVDIKEAVFCMIPIEGFRKESVEAVFLFFKGVHEMINLCTDMELLLDMLKLCNTFKMQSPLATITQKIQKCNITSENLMNIFETTEKFETIEQYKELSRDLSLRCLNFARSNLASWQVMTNFVLKHESKADLMVKLFKNLKQASAVTIRRRVINDNKVQDESPTFILANLEWKILIKRAFGFRIVVEVQQPDGTGAWSCSAQIQLKLVNKDGKPFHTENLEFTFGPGKEAKEFPNYKKLPQKLGSTKGFLLDAKITVKQVSDLHQFSSAIENNKEWFDLTPVVGHNNATSAEDSQKSDDSESKPSVVVVFLCDNNLPIAILQSLLIKESEYFRTLFASGSTSGKDVKTAQTRSFPVSGFNPVAIKSLVDYLKGFPELLESRQNFSVLTDILRFCQQYSISKPVESISKKMLQLPLSMDNLVQTFEASQALKLDGGCTAAVAGALEQKCVEFAGANLASWPALLSFIVDKSDNMKTVIEIIKHLAQNTKCVIRARFGEVSAMTAETSKNSPFTIRANFPWTIQIKKEINSNGKEYLGAYLYNDGSSFKNWSCDVKIL